MAKSFKEITRKAENLIEQGKEADREVKNCQSAVSSANTRVAAARLQLDEASETDEEGRPRGDVDSAKAELNMAEAQLAARERALSSARHRSDRIRSQKNSEVSEIERHNQIARANLEKLQKLKSLAFGENSATLAEGMAERLNEAEDARAKLLRSMGLDATPNHYSSSGEGTSAYVGGVRSFSSIDTRGTLQHYQGGSEGNLAGAGIAAPIGGGLVDPFAIRSGEENTSPKATSSQNDSKILNAIKNVFGFDNTTNMNASNQVDFDGIILRQDVLSDDRYFVQGNNYDKFSHYWQNASEYTRTCSGRKMTIDARDIEGIYLSETEVKDSHLFWNRGQQYQVDSAEYFENLASRIPEIQAKLDAGETAESIMKNPDLKDCYEKYFESPIEVYEADGYYVFASAGRHRCMAAQKLGCKIPVTIIGRIRQKIDHMELSENSFSDEYSGSVTELNNTQRLIDFVNSIPNADNNVLNLYNSIRTICNLKEKGIQFEISHGKNHQLYREGINDNGRIRTSKIVLNVPHFSGDNITGQVQTTLHENMHFIDQLLKRDVQDFYSPGFAASNQRLVNSVKNAPPSFGSDIKTVFAEHALQMDRISNDLQSRYNNEIADARDQLNKDGDFDAYLNKVESAKEKLEKDFDYQARNLMNGGVGQLEDIYDALSAGKYRDKGVVRYGHGSEYYKTDESRINEIIANYASLSVTRPDLVDLLRRDKPDLVDALDNVIDLMNQRVKEF